MNKISKLKSFFYKIGPAFLILALEIGSGKFILWPYLTANYGYGILWGALLGISIQLYLINLISKHTLNFNQNIFDTFQKYFPGFYTWLIFSTLIAFSWPGFTTLSAEIITEGFGLNHSTFIIFSIGILIIIGLTLIISKSAYKKILKIEKIIMSSFLLFILFLFIYYFDWIEFKKKFFGFLGKDQNYWFLNPDTDWKFWN